MSADIAGAHARQANRRCAWRCGFGVAAALLYASYQGAAMPRHLISTLGVVLVIATAGCGSDDSSSSASSPGAKSQDPATPSSERSSASAATQVSDGRATIAMSDFRFQPKALRASAGKLRVTANNTGKAPHEFVVIKTEKAPDALPTNSKGEASEAGAVGEIGEQQPGQSASHSFSLKPGTYVYICNVPGHYQSGMYGKLTVN
jgi:uncharacterized cupredoxin-like copper-binding protein